MSRLFQKDYSCVISSMKYINDDKELSIGTAFTCTKDHVVTLNELLAVCSYLGMTAAFRRTVFENVDATLWSETSHDWALFIEALHEGNIFFSGKCLQYHRMHSGNASGVSGETPAEKRINLLNRQVQHIGPIKRLQWVSVEQSNICDKYISILKKKDQLDKQNISCYSIVARFGEYRANRLYSAKFTSRSKERFIRKLCNENIVNTS